MTAVFVNGFDFGTSPDTIENHFAAVGNISEVRPVGNGSAVVTYSSMGDAHRAVTELHETTMEGNKRYVSVKMDGEGKGKGKGKGSGEYEGGKSNGRKGKDQAVQEPYTGKLQDGTVSTFFDDKGFGFISPDEGGSDLYVHFSAIQSEGYRSLQKGQAVRFGIGQDAKGDRSGKGKGNGKGKAVHVEFA